MNKKVTLLLTLMVLLGVLTACSHQDENNGGSCAPLHASSPMQNENTQSKPSIAKLASNAVMAEGLAIHYSDGILLN